LAFELHNWRIHVISLLLEIRDIGIQVVSEMFILFQAYYHLRMQRNRLAAGLLRSPDTV